MSGNGKEPREDGLPEQIAYRDNGCDVHASCLSCPLPRCKYDDPRTFRALLNQGRDQEIVRLRREVGLPIDALARQYGLSRRTIFRILRKGR